MYHYGWWELFVYMCIHMGTVFHNLNSFNMKAFLICTYLVAYSFCSIQKLFDKKFVTDKSFDLAKIKILHDSTQPMNKVTCSSLCLRDSRENCNAFRVNSENECELIENPEELQEANPDCLDKTQQSIWTSKDLKPPLLNEYVLVDGSLQEPYAEILNLACPIFQCKNEALPALRPTFQAFGAIINQVPIICGGEKMPKSTDKRYDRCYTLEDLDWKQMKPSTLANKRKNAGNGNIVINDQYFLVSGGIVHHGGGGIIKDQELVPLDGNIISSSLNSPSYFGHCNIQLTKTTILITGGIQTWPKYSSRTWFQNFETMKQEDGPEMNADRQQHACGKLKINGDTVLVVAGGFSKDPTEKLVSTEFLNLDSDNPVWTEGIFKNKTAFPLDHHNSNF